MLTLKTIAALSPGRMAWDDGKGAVAGFGARRQKGPAVSYVLKYRTADGRQRWQTIGRHGAPWTPDLARAQARRILGEVAKGSDPATAKQEARKAATVAELCDLYLEAVEAGRVLTRRKIAKRPATIIGDKGRVERHIKPLLGSLKVAAVTRADVERFRDGVSEGATAALVKTGKHGLARVTGGHGTATRALGMLGALFGYAVRQGLRPDNPVTGVERHAYEPRQRRASEAEYKALGEALDAMPKTVWPVAVAATRFLVLTGWRRGEALALTWAEVDLDTRTARLADTKTGYSLRPLSRAACDVLRALPRMGVLVFPASVGFDKPMVGFHKIWLRIAAQAILPADVTPHILRHSFASVAADLGYSELTIAALIGHKKASVTSKYAHHADAVLLAAADAVAERIVCLMCERQNA
ncbi:MAG: tyrosine-type recombinase/integrase [Methylocystis sp.]